MSTSITKFLGSANAFALALGCALAGATSHAAEFTHARGANQVVARLSILSGERGDSAHSVTVYGTGLVRAHYPAHLKNAGTREVQLSEAELRTLLESLAESGLPDFDSAAVMAECAQLEAARQEFFFSSGADVIEIELNLDDYRGRPTEAQRRLRKRVSWRGLPQATQRFPEIEALTGLDQATGTLKTLLQRGDLARGR